LKFLLSVKWGSIYNSAVDFLDTENMGKAVGISLLSRPETETYILPVWATVILKLRLSVTSGNIRNNAIDIMGPETLL
jgi:hypothetical protein